MAETWFISDHHFQHKKVLELQDAHELLLRPEFDDVSHMNSFMIDMHNSVVGLKDEVWFLGDVVWKDNLESKEILGSLNGILNLCPGNHDDIKFLAPFFKEIRLWKKWPELEMICSHVPLAHGDVKRFKYNVHGHLHEKNIMLNGKEDPRYLNVSVEQLGYIPINLDEIKLLLTY